MGEQGERQTMFAPVATVVARAGLPAAAELRPPVPVRLAPRHTATNPWATFARGIEALPQACVRQAAQERDHGHLFLFSPVFLGAGAVTWFGLAEVPSPLPVGVILVASLLAAFVCRHGHPLGHYAAMAVALFAGGMLLAGVEAWRSQTVVLDSPVTTRVTGVVERRASDDDGNWRYLVRLTATASPALKRPPQRATLLARSRHDPFPFGSTLTGLARLQPPAGPALPRMNDFAFSAYYNGVGAVGYFLGAPQSVNTLSPPQPGPQGWLAAADLWLFGLRDRIESRIRSVVAGDAGAFAAAIVTGESRGMSKETKEALRISGLTHIIAISGLNMALAAGLFYVGLRAGLSLLGSLSQAYPIKKFAAAGAILAAFGYYLISGYQVSAERAFLMMAIMLGAVLIDRPAISLRNTALAALAIIAVSPSQIMGPSFQMSFSATIALIAGYAAWQKTPDAPVTRQPRPLVRGALFGTRLAAGIFMTSLIGGLSTALFAIEHFHRLAGYSLPANLVAMPVISLVVMPFGLLAMTLMPFGLDALPLKVMGAGLELVIAVAKTIAGWGGDIGFRRIDPMILPLAITGFLILALLRSRLRYAGIAFFAAALAVAALKPQPRQADLLIAEDGQLVGLPTADTIQTNRPRPPAFIYGQWQQALQIWQTGKPIVLIDDQVKIRAAGADPPVPTAADIDHARESMRKALQTVERKRFACLPKAWCLAATAGGWTVAVVEQAAYVGPACDVADIVVTPRRTAFTTCRSGARLYTAETLRRTGALEIRFGNHDGGDIAVTKSFAHTSRAWMQHRRYDWRLDSYFQGRTSPPGDAPVFNAPQPATPQLPVVTAVEPNTAPPPLISAVDVDVSGNGE